MLDDGAAPLAVTPIVVTAGSIVELTGPTRGAVTIEFGSGYGALILHAPASMAATISGFTGTAPDAAHSDVINLVGVGALNTSNLSYSTATHILTVTDNFGAVAAALHFSGNYTTASFQAAPDGHGGTNIYDPINPIVAENALAGAPVSSWGLHGSISGTGDENIIEGFATNNLSVNVGEAVNFKINTASSNYKIDIYRIGYYGGDGARLVASMHENQASIQPAPLFDPTTRLTDAGNWSVTATWNVPTTAVSGLYFAKLTTEDGTNGQNMMPFVVTNTGSTAPIAFQTNDTTWEAYNAWGGYNLYTGPSGTNADRAYEVSYNRPIDINSESNLGGPHDFPLSSEFETIYWLEKNGYNVTYTTGTETAESGSTLLNSQVYLTTGHDEYASQAQRNNIQAAANQGVNLIALGGNNTYWDIAYAPSIDPSHTAYSTIVQYKDPWAGGQINPNGTAGGGSSLFRDPIYGPGQPENGLWGNLFTVDDVGENLLPVQIPYSLSQFQFWNNTSVATLQPGQTASLSPYLLGYEWNSDVNNGFRPAGVIDLSSTTATVNSLLLDYGKTTGPGTATSSLTLYRNPISGALVFASGTDYWSMGLATNGAVGSNDPTGQLEDPAVQQSLVNLLGGMGVQAGSLQSGLVPSNWTNDPTPPTSAITSIGSGGALVSNQIATIEGTATDTDGGRVAMVEISTDGGQTWNRATGFANWSYSWIVPGPGTYTVKTRATNDSAYLETPGDAQTVTVTSSPTVSIFSSSPGDVVFNTTISDNLNSGDPTANELGVTFKSVISGTISGIRFYKGVDDLGTHTGSLWTSSGTLLATGTFSNETATGWQTLTFSTPVSITATETYVAGYSSNGNYPVSSNYFRAPHANGPLRGLTGVEGNPGVFPTTTFASNNYWVDVLFEPATSPQPPIANDDTGFITAQNTPLSISASFVLANDIDQNDLPLSVSGVSNPVNGTVSFNKTTNVITFTPTLNYTGPASFTYMISDTANLVNTATVSFVVDAPGAIVDLFPANLGPTVPSANDPNPVNLGVKFIAATSGTISGVSFYKGPTDTGTHVGSLFSSSGALLASGTFANETASGWQTLTFSAPVVITGGETYVAAYHSNGGYAATPQFFTTPYTTGLLTAPAGANGVYAYSGSANVFPTNSYGSTNYFVDVNFAPSAPQPPTANADIGFASVANLPTTIAAASLLANDTDPNGFTLAIQGVSNPINGTVSFNATTSMITFMPAAGYTGSASFSYTAVDGGGLISTPTNVSLTINPPQAPVANADSELATQNTPLLIAPSTLLANDADPNGLIPTITGVSNAVNGTVSLGAASEAGTSMITFTPLIGFTGAASFTYTISDATGLSSNSAPVTVAVNAPGSSESLFLSTDAPGITNVNDPNSVELGVKFSTSTTGYVTGFEFYKGTQDTGPHTGHLWSANGTLLASATFANETASGWQSVTLSNPVAITAGTTYTASYHTSGNYSATGAYFTSSHTSAGGILTALSSASSGGNGVYAYGTTPIVPTNTFNATNYWVDVLYSPGAIANQPPVANNDGGFIATEITATQTAPLTISGLALLANDTDPNGGPLAITGVSNPSQGAVSFNAGSNTVTFTPTSGYTGPAGFTYSIGDGHGGAASANVSLTVVGDKLFSSSDVPVITNVNDLNSVELGVKFTAAQAGQVIGFEFYKGTQDTGPHTGHLWSANGTLLASATFTNETASGWQSVTLSNPVAITAGTTYTASYHTSGNYSATGAYFASSHTSAGGSLTALSSASSGGNGVYAYGTTPVAPTNTFNATNYWVDILFNGQLAA